MLLLQPPQKSEARSHTEANPSAYFLMFKAVIFSLLLLQQNLPQGF